MCFISNSKTFIDAMNNDLCDTPWEIHVSIRKIREKISRILVAAKFKAINKALNVNTHNLVKFCMRSG